MMSKAMSADSDRPKLVSTEVSAEFAKLMSTVDRW